MTIIPVPDTTVEDFIDRSRAQSVQVKPEVSKEGTVNYWSIGGWRGSFLAAYGTMQREFELQNWYRMDEQALVRGAFTGLAKHIGNLPWEITGDDAPSEMFASMGQELGRNTANGVEYYQQVLRLANMGAGWGQLMTQVVLDFLRYDTGAFIEVIGAGDSYTPLTGPVTGIAHLDPLACIPTGDPMYPCVYYDLYGGIHALHFTRVICLQDMNDGDQRRPGWGDSALARAISIAARQMWITRYINTYLDDQPAPGLDIINGITKGQFDQIEAKFQQMEQMDVKPRWGARVRYHTPDPAITPKIESVQWQTAPEKFDFRVYTDIDVDTLALAMGVDRQELMQLMGGGAIGSEAQSIILHQKSKGKTIGYLITELERRFNDLLPDGFTFGFKYRDEQEAKQEAEKANLWGDFLSKVKDILTPEQQQILLASNIEAVHEAISTAPRVNDVDVTPETAPVTAGDDTAGAEQVGAETPEETPPVDTKAKSYAVTQSNYLQELRSLVKAAVEKTGVIGRYSFGIRARDLLKRYGLQAFKDGMFAGGVLVDELDDEDLSDYQKVFVDQASYIGGFSDDIYVNKAVTLNNLDMRVNAWGKSLQAFVDQGLYVADKNGMYIWVRNPLKDSCKDCKRLENQVHRFKTWKLSGYLPRSSKLACWGAECGCELKKSSEKARGRF